ncbi:site-specific integrase [Acidicapsa acidisoli]|uniref:site-specific integrase n=1 Tax=Acidicapsa acidisoli TaxID=1615681 RepID=UPI0021DF6277|nr:site-specific integrase [Acidicapsa acidisoli]
MTDCGIIPTTGSLERFQEAKWKTPALFSPSPRAEERFWDFFTSNIRNRHTRRAYLHAALRFSEWCSAWTITDLRTVRPINVATYIEQMLQTHSKPTVKLHLAALRVLFDWMVVGQQIETNPAQVVRGPKHSVRRGKTIPVSPEEVRLILGSIETDTLIGLRDRALIAMLFNTVSRISAALSMRVEDYFTAGRDAFARLQEKGGKEHVVPVNHVLAQYMDAYIHGAGLADDPKGPLFRTSPRWSVHLERRPMLQGDAYHMIARRRRAVGITTKIGNHSFRAGGITTYLKNGGYLEVAQRLAGHASPVTTQIYDHRDDEVSRAEVERIAI